MKAQNDKVNNIAWYNHLMVSDVVWNGFTYWTQFFQSMNVVWQLLCAEQKIPNNDIYTMY